jgi:hypothetical protein
LRDLARKNATIAKLAHIAAKKILASSDKFPIKPVATSAAIPNKIILIPPTSDSKILDG